MDSLLSFSSSWPVVLQSPEAGLSLPYVLQPSHRPSHSPSLTLLHTVLDPATHPTTKISACLPTDPHAYSPTHPPTHPHTQPPTHPLTDPPQTLIYTFTETHTPSKTFTNHLLNNYWPEPDTCLSLLLSLAISSLTFKVFKNDTQNPCAG